MSLCKDTQSAVVCSAFVKKVFFFLKMGLLGGFVGFFYYAKLILPPFKFPPCEGSAPGSFLDIHLGGWRSFM